ncbi:hypothetical protein TNIN_368511 [Trichonephila inaurata madagascariensis]|uniref:C2H2-type domain-containing protein n=1 Tax=Trichonephila inaurata madagascariensis TaxID=2747483 RepID=A0A8X7CDW2_9ARAC|nr:hypothetical protein TNIN_368511 [Trichonephila inaurata madagascariensis]
MSRNSSKQISGVIKRHKCSQCSYSTNNAGHLHMHFLTHSGVRPFVCSFCAHSKRFYVNQHSSTISHSLGLYESKIKKGKFHCCPICPYYTIYTTNYRAHLNTHTGSKPFKCPTCGVQLYQYQNLFSSFDVKSRNRNNILRWGSSPAKRHRCSLCPYSTNNSSHLQIHLVTHTGERPHKCTKCGKTFSQRSSLRRHIMCHIDLSIQL